MFQSLDSRSPLNKTPSQQLESIRYFRRDQDKRKRVPFHSSETAGDLPLPASRLLTALIFPAVPSVRTLLPSTGPGTSFPFAITPTRAFSLLSGWLRSHLLRENFWVTLLTCAPPHPSSYSPRTLLYPARFFFLALITPDISRVFAHGLPSASGLMSRAVHHLRLLSRLWSPLPRGARGVVSILQPASSSC